MASCEVHQPKINLFIRSSNTTLGFFCQLEITKTVVQHRSWFFQLEVTSFRGGLSCLSISSTKDHFTHTVVQHVFRFHQRKPPLIQTVIQHSSQFLLLTVTSFRWLLSALFGSFSCKLLHQDGDGQQSEFSACCSFCSSA